MGKLTMAGQDRGPCDTPGSTGGSSGEGAARFSALALLTAALVWGVIWYPYRMLHEAGISGVVSTTFTYSLAFLLALSVWRPRLQRPEHPWLLLGLGLAAGGCNLGYVMATIGGEVVRVLLLFYLAPLWTVLLSRLLLGERLNRFGAFVVLLSLAGAMTMLWRTETGLPLPRDAADWFGLAAGFCFALFNVLSRRARDLPVSQRVLVAFLGVVVLGGLLGGIDPPAVLAAPAVAWLLLLVVGALLLVINLVAQHGLAHTPANRAIVIMLSEVGFAALSSWLLAGETPGLQEWIGGTMIVVASLFSARMRG